MQAVRLARPLPNTRAGLLKTPAVQTGSKAGNYGRLCMFLVSARPRLLARPKSRSRCSPMLRLPKHLNPSRFLSQRSVLRLIWPTILLLVQSRRLETRHHRRPSTTFPLLTHQQVRRDRGPTPKAKQLRPLRGTGGDGRVDVTTPEDLEVSKRSKGTHGRLCISCCSWCRV